MDNKPIDLLIEDAKQDIYNILNATGLPLSIMEFMLKEVMETVMRQKAELLGRLRAEQLQSEQESEQNNN